MYRKPLLYFESAPSLIPIRSTFQRHRECLDIEAARILREACPSMAAHFPAGGTMMFHLRSTK